MQNFALRRRQENHIKYTVLKTDLHSCHSQCQNRSSGGVAHSKGKGDPRHEKTGFLPMQLHRAFVFATQIVQFLFFLNPKFQASSHLL